PSWCGSSGQHRRREARTAAPGLSSSWLVADQLLAERERLAQDLRGLGLAPLALEEVREALVRLERERAVAHLRERRPVELERLLRPPELELDVRQQMMCAGDVVTVLGQLERRERQVRVARGAAERLPGDVEP